MNNQTPIDDPDEKPLDPAMERVRRKMVRLLVISIGIMMAGLMAVLYAIVYKVSQRGEPAAVSKSASDGSNAVSGGFDADLALPVGTRVVSHNLSGDRLSVLVEDAGGKQSIHIFDIANRRVLGRVNIGDK